MRQFLKGSGIADADIPRWIAVLNDDYAVGENIIKGTPEYDQVSAMKSQWDRYTAGRRA